MKNNVISCIFIVEVFILFREKDAAPMEQARPSNESAACRDTREEAFLLSQESPQAIDSSFTVAEK